jgi:hypothetical protein
MGRDRRTMSTAYTPLKNQGRIKQLPFQFQQIRGSGISQPAITEQLIKLITSQQFEIQIKLVQHAHRSRWSGYREVKSSIFLLYLFIKP